MAGPSLNDHGIETRVAKVGDEGVLLLWTVPDSRGFDTMLFSDLEAFLAFKNVTEQMRAQVIAAYDEEEIDLAELSWKEAFLDGFWKMSPAGAADQA